MAVVNNPILPGFHPDPSIVRVGADYYLANSTFEWWPGIRLHHSTDLVNWTPAGHAITEALDLRGVPDSGGIWAPSLSFHSGQFWLVFAVVNTKDGPFKDMDVLLVTAPGIEGPWSMPRYLGGAGFDPSIFHDDDGRHWLVNMAWDPRPDRPSFAGITLQELGSDKRQLIHTSDMLIEGPNLYRRDGWYYLMLAAGGTGWNHGITVARSRDLAGPYEEDPNGPLLTTRDNDDIPLQKAGHGELVETPAGEWFLVHLASRPLTVAGERRCVLGRETCLQRITWTEDGWPRLAHGGHWPADTVTLPGTPRTPQQLDGFANPEWQSLRQPISEQWLSLTERPGWLRLKGRHSPSSRFTQSMIARRLTSFHAQVTTAVSVQPEHPGQQAGLVCWYDTSTHYFLGVGAGNQVIVSTSDDGEYTELNTGITAGDLIHLRATIDRERLQFAVSTDGEAWKPVGPELDMTKLSDDYGSSLRFTGAFVGLAAHDPVTGTLPADFAYFDFRPVS